MDHCVPFLCGALGTIVDGCLVSCASTRRAFGSYLSSSRDGYSAISQDEQERLLEDEPDSEEEDENNRRNLANQERAWRDQASSSKAGKVLGINSKARKLLGLASQQPQQHDSMRVSNRSSSPVFNAEDSSQART